MPVHFGVTVLYGKRGLKLTRENYAIVSNKNSLIRFKSIVYADKEGKFYTDEWCAKHLRNCLENFDLNMKFFSVLNRHDFNDAINKFVRKNKGFKSVSDLNAYDDKSGYYMMVLDEYCQIYIGTTDNIKRRIRQHWTKSKSFDRLLFPIGAVDTSILSIDSFRAYDTTRIYAYITQNTYEQENKYINQFASEFVCNRLNGGRVTDGLLQTINMMKQRQL